MAAITHTTPTGIARILSRRPPFLREIGIAIVAYLIYEAARVLTAGSYPIAYEHAQQVVALERHLNLNVEGGVQRALLHSPLITVLNYVYLAAQNLVLPASLVLLYRLNRTTYRTLRNTLLATWLLSLPVYALFAAAPPRLAGLGIVDTVSDGSPLKMESGTTTTLVNQFAAVPSLHVGFAFAIGIAVGSRAAPARPARRRAAVGADRPAQRRRHRQPLRVRRDRGPRDHGHRLRRRPRGGQRLAGAAECGDLRDRRPSRP